MAVKIRLARRGRKKLAIYDVVVADARAPRDGRFIEKIGTYNPLTHPMTLSLDNDRAFYWVMQGAQPSDAVKAMLSLKGILLKKHLQIGVNKGAITQEQADAKLEAWVKEKEEKFQTKRDHLTNAKLADVKARKEAETKIKEKRAEAIKKKAIVVEEATQAVEEAAQETVEIPLAEGEVAPQSDAPTTEGETQA